MLDTQCVEDTVESQHGQDLGKESFHYANIYTDDERLNCQKEQPVSY